MRTRTNPDQSGSGSFVFGRVTRCISILALWGGLAAPGVLLQAGPACAAGKEAGRAGVVIKFSESRQESRCISLHESKPEISGIEALRAIEDIEVVTKDFGGDLGEAVCKIGDVGTDDCDFNAGFWAYYHAAAQGTWQEAQEGASSHRLTDEAVDGWAWAPAGATQTPPKTTRFDEVCAKPTATPKAARDEKDSLLPWVVIGGVALALVIGTILSRKIRRPA